MTVQFSPVFQNSAVFPAHNTFRVFGSGQIPTGSVTITFNGQTVQARQTKPIGDGVTWIAEFSPMEYGGPYEMTLKANKEKTVLYDLYVGEVILMAGQSNIQFKMKESSVENPDDFSDEPNLRFLTLDRIDNSDKFHLVDGWIPCRREDVEEWPAIGYHFGKQLITQMGCAVGLVGCYQGASVIESWIPQGLGKKLFVPLELRHIDHTDENYSAWNTDGKLYNDMFRKLIPMTFSAIVWYQGESDTSDAEAAVYAEELAVMVKRWRSDLLDDRLPLAIVQIADFDLRSDNGWKNLQKAQEKAANDIPYSALVISRDVCESNEIHPVTKSKLSSRLADTVVNLLNNKSEQ